MKTVGDIARLSEGQAMLVLSDLRWPLKADGVWRPACPRCQFDSPYFFGNRDLFKCKACAHQFSVTSGTIFAGSKRSCRDILIAAHLFAGAKKGISSLQLNRYLGGQYKPDFVLAHKFREALEARQSDVTLSGIVEIDGCVIGGHKKACNRLSVSLGRRLYLRRYAFRRVIVGAYSRDENRYRTFVVMKESDAKGALAKCISAGSVIASDSARAWNSLANLYDMLRVNHNLAFSHNGASTNNMERLWAGLRRMHKGQHHRMSPEYLPFYAAEACWRAETSKMTNEERADDLLRAAFAFKGRSVMVGVQSSKAKRLTAASILEAA